ncbi:MAG TPA: EamA family transporter [Anaerolineales bacterium]|jgi:drug/metabolite transporter (DMT)-like permease|nr:EamA family transporter [Anaerolineales bacterium]
MMNITEVPAEEKITFQALVPVFIVYLAWGATYLAIRFGVREGSGFPPFSFASVRYLSAGGLLWLWGISRKRRMAPTKEEWRTLILSGILMLVGGNGMVTWAEQQADSSLAALLVAAVPIWAILIEAVLNRRRPSFQLLAAVLVGFSGIALLAVPGMLKGIQAEVLSIGALLIAGFSWASGSVRQVRWPVSLDPAISSGYQMLIGGVGLLVLSRLTGEPVPSPTIESWIALVFLSIFGSVLAFTAYVTALKTLPIQIVMTYTYVNPVIAVLLGWIILDEQITPWTLGGMALVLLGVVGVFRERYLRRGKVQQN